MVIILLIFLSLSGARTTFKSRLISNFRELCVTCQGILFLFLRIYAFTRHCPSQISKVFPVISALLDCELLKYFVFPLVYLNPAPVYC